MDFAVDPSMALGAGFDSVGYRVMGDCVQTTAAEPAVGTGQTVTFSILQVEDYDTLTKSLDLSTSGGAKAVVWSAEGRAKLVRALSVNNYSPYALASVLVQNAPNRMRNVKLSVEASELLRTRGSKAFHEVCGDQFVVGSITGGEFRAIIEIQARSEQEKQTISAGTSGGYGIFTGKGDFEQALNKVVRGKRLQVYVYRTGGVGAVVPVEPQDMMTAAVNFPALVSGGQAQAVTALTQGYKTLFLPPEANPLDLATQRDVVTRLGALASGYLEQLNNINYVLANAREFVSPDFDALTRAHNDLSVNFNRVRQAASDCYRDIDKCDLPTDLIAVNLLLPERHRRIEDYCQNPVYEAQVDALCGPARFNRLRGPECGIEVPAEGIGAVCGVESFHVARGEPCGVEQYNEQRAPICGQEYIEEGQAHVGMTDQECISKGWNGALWEYYCWR